VSGFIAWEGNSPVTGDPLVLVVTGRSHNTKTGPMYQAWLLLRDVAPFDAIAQGADRAICGSCVHRGIEKVPNGTTQNAKRTCYVSMFKGPAKIWQLARAGAYPRLTTAEAGLKLAGEYVRVTAYGDPAFVPLDVWRAILRHADGWVGYTHQWATCDPGFRAWLMASVETEREAAEAHARGWRTFRARSPHEALRKDEFQCPASEEAGHRATCVTCLLCRGTSSPAKSVSILLHGQRAAPRRGLPRSRHDAMRQELTDTGYSVQAMSREESSSVMLAIRQFYRRRRVDVAFRTKRLRHGLYLFWRGNGEAHS
jgi:hypothetical protein